MTMELEKKKSFFLTQVEAYESLFSYSPIFYNDPPKVVVSSAHLE